MHRGQAFKPFLTLPRTAWHMNPILVCLVPAICQKARGKVPITSIDEGFLAEARLYD